MVFLSVRPRSATCYCSLGSLILILLILRPSLVSTSRAPTTTVQTSLGSITGLVDESGRFASFFGIPYAREQRWVAPVDLTSFPGGTHDGTEVGPICPQLPSSWQRPLPMSEDCLSLNIWTPLASLNSSSSSSSSGLPVLVFIHGGAFVIGSGVGRYIAGQRLNQHGALLVSFNYRLGVFGFLSHREANGDGDQLAAAATVNYGLLDQFSALRWVQRHISEFGGDPSRVTLAGESAGAISALWLAANPHLAGVPSSSPPLFSRIISQSSAPPLLVSSLEVAYLASDHFQRNLGCRSLSCLRDLPYESVLAHTPSFPWRRSAILYNDLVAYDIGLVSPHPTSAWKYPADAIRAGDFHVDVLQGVTSHESYLFIAASHLAGHPAVTDLREIIHRAFPMMNALQIDAVGALYFHGFSFDAKHVESSSSVEMLSDLDTDLSFACVERRLSLDLVENTNVTVYRYVFDHVSEHFDGDMVLAGLTERVGHTFELPYVFGTAVGKAFPSRFNEEEELLCDRIVSAWVRFCEGKAPTPEWPPVNLEHEPTVFLKPGEWVVEERRRHTECTFWEMIFPHMELVGVGWDQFHTSDELGYEHPVQQQLQQLLFEMAYTNQIPARLSVALTLLVALVIVTTYVFFCRRCRHAKPKQP